MTDLHTHILPGMDDGPQELAAALALLEQQARQGIRRIALTSHYDCTSEPLAQFLNRREASFAALRAAAPAGLDLKRGCEVWYSPELLHIEASKLCLEGTPYLLLELPFRTWGKEELRQVSNFNCARGITPILAHYERYRSLQSRQMYVQMARQDVLVQKNAESFSGFFRERRACREVKSGMIHLLGSDCHNLGSRKPNMNLAAESLQRRGLQKELDRITKNSWEIFSLANKESRG